MADVGGDPACWLDAVCDRCGALIEAGEPHRCRVGLAPRVGSYAAGVDLEFGRTRPTATPGVSRVVVGYEEETLGRACLEAARELLRSLTTPEAGRVLDAAGIEPFIE